MTINPLLYALDTLRGKEAKQIKSLAKRQSNDKNKYLNEKKDHLDCTHLLARFLFHIVSKINPKFMSFAVELLIMTNVFKVAIDEYGSSFSLYKSKEENVEVTKLNMPYSSTRKIASIFIMSNYFLSELFPKFLEKMKW